MLFCQLIKTHIVIARTPFTYIIFEVSNMEEKNLPYEKAIEAMAREYKKVLAKPIQAYPYMGETKVFFSCNKLLSNAKLNDTAIKPLANLWNIYSELTSYAKLIFERTNIPEIRELFLLYIKINTKILSLLSKLFTKLTGKPPIINYKTKERFKYGDIIRRMLILNARAQSAYIEYTEIICGMRTALAVLPRYSNCSQYILLSLLGF